MAGARPQRIVFISQVYPPDPTSVGQHLGDAAAELAARGHKVEVVTANRAYENPAQRYPRHETLRGVDVRRIGFSSFGKKKLALRMLAGLSFTVQAAFRVLFRPGVDVVVVSTVPPVGSLATLLVGLRRRTRIVFWVMDLNPDQAVAMGAMRPDALPVRLLEWGLRKVLRRADVVVALDKAMAARLEARGDLSGRLTILPPWPLDDHVEPVPHEANPFRKEHGLDGRFVVMYSGNHSPANPIDTLLETARSMAGDERFLFMFVGGGSEKAKVERSGLPNVRSLPYQPLESLRFSLSAADLHAVTMGDAVVGIVHPCKIYGAMAVARPVLSFGPANSHIAELVGGSRLGWHVPHGDVEGAVRAVRAAAASSELAQMGARGRALLAGGLGKDALCGRFCDLVDGSAASAA